VEIILTHENADFDAVASLLAAHKLNADAMPVLPARLNKNVADFVSLYQNGLPFIQLQHFRAKSVTHVTLVDTQRLPAIRRIRPNTALHIVDHHPLSQELEPHQTFSGELVGATTTLLVEQIRARSVPINSLEATLMALGIYEDTGSLSYGTTTARDLHAAAWLLEHEAVLDAIRRFLAPPLNEEQQRLFDALLASAESRTIEGNVIIVAQAKVDDYISEISSVAHRLRDLLDPAALFVLVQMPGSLQLVGRATGNIIDAGEIARLFGGGGHQFASAASIHDKTLDEAAPVLWEEIQHRIRPATRVANLMSYGVQTVAPDKKISEIIQQMRRIGHEGFPVIENGHIIGLLTRRDADRAVEHGLGSLTVREVMASGKVSLTLNDSVSALEQVMVESGWGQIPVLDDHGSLLGIVTRTDLIKHWARSHPPSYAQPRMLSTSQIENVLGPSVSALIQALARNSDKLNLSTYMVGGAVRDLLLRRRNLDIDFVVEGDAIRFARSLKGLYGGRVSAHPPFGTAKWILDENVAKTLEIDSAILPPHIDFATARNEFYEHPTALPTVYNSSIKLDLQRRDFTINTIAVQVSPSAVMGTILDYYGGQDDLHAGLIRVLHSLSFVDDPTRILRAVRLSQRLGFTIEQRTSELINTALPMLRRITGKRIHDELTLLLCEPEPERGLYRLQDMGALAAIHPAFLLDTSMKKDFQTARNFQSPWPMEPVEMSDIYWHILASMISFDQLPDWCECLAFGQRVTDSLLDGATVVRLRERLSDSQVSPSQIVHDLEGRSELALLTAWLIVENPLARERIQRYKLEWQYVKPNADGHTLLAQGIPPGQCYAIVLRRLRDAWLDGEINSHDEENRLLRILIAEACYDPTS
jgi:tRNA nucleotidyltransferase (CCA-adding enzyme)